MGTDTPISALSRQAEAALHLLQAELRAGDEPADRSDPRRARHEPRLVHRPAAEPVRPRRPRQHQAAGGAPADPDQRRSREDPLRSRRLRTSHFDSRTLDITFHAEQGAAGMEQALDDSATAREAAVREGVNIIILSDRMVGAGPHPDPVAAGDRGRASSPDPQRLAHLGRPRRRIRRAARGASLRLPRRLRRGGDQPLSRVRDHRSR